MFFSASPRHLSLTQARALVDAADSDTQLAVPPRRVALCVDASDDELTAIVDAARPNMLQLHGNETVERVRAIKSKFSLPVMPVRSQFDSSVDGSGTFLSYSLCSFVLDLDRCWETRDVERCRPPDSVGDAPTFLPDPDADARDSVESGPCVLSLYFERESAR